MRYLRNEIESVLNRKMVFIGGPRQVGKTTLCLSFLNNNLPEDNSAYLNWDDVTSKSIIRNAQIPANEKVICFDEIHKFKNWRSLVKGLYDKQKNIHQFIITGSARLDHYRKGGDSLLGRYRYFRLHPFSLSEMGAYTIDNFKQLFTFGGFPEPLFLGSVKEHRIWQKERLYRVVNDDIRDLEQVREINNIELLAELIPARVGSPLSIKKLAGELESHHQSIEKWVQILERVYFCYRIKPFEIAKTRTVKKEKKIYLWDWSSVENEGIRYENMLAGQLLKFCHFLEDTEGYRMELKYLRDTEQREVDFVVIQDKKPLFAVECKSGEKEVSKHLIYFKNRVKIPQWFQVHLGKSDYESKEGVRVLPFTRFCQELQMP